MDKRDKPLDKAGLRKIYILIVFVLTVLGMYFFGQKASGSKKIAALLAAGLAAGLVILMIIGARAGKKGKQRGIIGTVTLIMLIGLFLINGRFLIVTYFIPHNTTTIYNRYFPESVEHSWQLETYLTGKTLYVDASNDFIGRAEDALTPIDHINTVAIFSSVKTVKTLDEPFGKLTKSQVNFLMEDDGAFYLDENMSNRQEKLYLYLALDSDYDQVVFLQDDADNAYFVPYQVYKVLKDIG